MRITCLSRGRGGEYTLLGAINIRKRVYTGRNSCIYEIRSEKQKQNKYKDQKGGSAWELHKEDIRICMKTVKKYGAKRKQLTR